MRAIAADGFAAHRDADAIAPAALSAQVADAIGVTFQAKAKGRRRAWWAGQDSNLQPDRYERPALTIELPAL